jgi:hemerythrin-like domain-containing protein
MSIDTTDMHPIHKVFRLACDDAPAAFGQAEGEVALAAVGSFYETVLGFLHCHHAAEDALLFPLLSQRCPAARSLLSRMDAQHEAVTSALARAEALLARWRTNPGGHVRTELVSAMGVLGAELGAHIDEEEAHVLPLAADHVTLDEWGAMPRQAMASFASDRKWLIQGLVRQHMTESQLAHLTKALPPAAIEAWVTAGSRAFAELMGNMPGARPHRMSA